jgi:hypothetical protein
MIGIIRYLPCLLQVLVKYVMNIRIRTLFNVFLGILMQNPMLYILQQSVPFTDLWNPKDFHNSNIGKRPIWIIKYVIILYLTDFLLWFVWRVLFFSLYPLCWGLFVQSSDIDCILIAAYNQMDLVPLMCSHISLKYMYLTF